MTKELTNSLADLAERIRDANATSEAAALTSIEKALVAGRLLMEAKSECRHGEWSPFLGRAGIHERQARRLMQLAKSGMKTDTVSELGGLKAALDHLVKRRLPDPGQCLLVSRDGWFEAPQPDYRPLVCISPNLDHPGFFDISSIDLSVEPPVGCYTRKPVTGEEIRLPDGSYAMPLWDIVDSFLPVPASQRDFSICPSNPGLHAYLLREDA
jgi:hypothetical protein